ncbi:hypothetical protein HA402_007678 [Bradysia odoriphaga]|nr:hypothetical protein HA402_007678 [Bradysia odoriphaga]
MNLENTSHALIYPKSDAANKKSSIVYGNYILGAGTILTKLVEEKKLKKNIENRLMTNKVITVKDEEWMSLKSEIFIVILKNKNDLVRRQARLKYIFNSNTIFESIKDILSGFRSYKVPFDQIGFHQLLVSSFVILEFCDNKSNQNDDESLIDVMNADADSMESLNKLDTVICVTTPFAHESFFNTVNVSKVANIFGLNKCMLIISAPLVYGCEGGGVYGSNQKLIGIVINTTFCWNNETAILSLVADYRNITREFLQRVTSRTIKCPSSESASKCLMQRSVLLIQSGASWGTGCLLKVNGTRMIITCSHIIAVDTLSTVTCFMNKTKFSSKVLYKNPKFNHAYDIAILEVPTNIPNNCFTEYATVRPRVGDSVYSVGFPHFSSLSTKIDSPSIYDGRITKLSKGMILADVNVQAGQSGCPLFNEDKKLLGVCISNSKDSVYNLVYPNISMAVPIYDIIPILNEFSLSGDKNVLNQLEAEDSVMDVWQLKPPQIISKL